jgi:hypothetical protein
MSSTATKEAFDYSSVPLSHTVDQIRLLRFSDLDRDFQAETCYLEVFALYDVPKYAALSYIWGSTDNPVPWTCNGDGTIGITHNLHTALSHITSERQSLFRRERYQYLWADAICINQGDLEERSAQVLIMRQIYERADHTLIWLGNEDLNAMAAFDFIIRLKDRREKYTAANETRLWAALSDQECHIYSVGPDDMDDLRKVNPFLSTGWFTRVWVVQELAASRLPTCLCGFQELMWKDFADVVSYLGGGGFPIGLLTGIAGIRAVARLNGIRARVAERNPTVLIDLLVATQGFDCTEIHDRIYALLGMAIDAGRSGLNILPDYSRDALTVFYELTASMLQKGGYLDVLNSKERSKRIKTVELPSWVSNWSTASNFAVYFLPNPVLAVDDQPFFSNYAAAPKVRSGEVTFVGSNLLQLCGYLFGTISVVGLVHDAVPVEDRTGCQYSEKDSEKAVLCQVLKSIRVARRFEHICNPRSAASYLPTDESMMDTYFQTLVAGQLRESFEDMKRGFELWYDKQKLFRFVPSSRQLNPLGIAILRRAMYQDIEEHYDAMSSFEFTMFSGTMSEVNNDRRLLRTKDGYIGLGPADATKGDAIFIIKGCRTPMVLRNIGRSGHWSLVGACYLHGCMNGEAYVEDRCHDIWIE